MNGLSIHKHNEQNINYVNNYVQKQQVYKMLVKFNIGTIAFKKHRKHRKQNSVQILQNVERGMVISVNCHFCSCIQKIFEKKKL